MRLEKLVIENFKGIKKFEFEPRGMNASIYGTNASGKTTVADAISWLLFDKPSTEEKGFNPKPKDGSGNDIHYLDTVVDAWFTGGDDYALNLTKVFREVWTKKRGSTDAEFTGHTTEYKIDGVPVTKKAFDDRTAGICPMHLAPVLSKPTYFGDVLPWQDRRKILLEICGDVSMDDVIDSDPSLDGLREVLLKPGTSSMYTTSEYLNIAKAKIKKLNEELKILPERIDESKKSLGTLSDGDEDAALSEFEKLDQELQDAQDHLSYVKSQDGSDLIKKEIEELKAEIRFKLREHESAVALANERKYMRIREIDRDIKSIRFDIESIQKRINAAMKDSERMKKKREEMLEKYRSEKSKVFLHDDVCPTCGQILPDYMIREAEERFNLSKSKALEKIAAETKESCSKDMILNLENQIAMLTTEIDKLLDKEKILSDEKSEIEKDLKCPPFEDTDDYKELRERVVSLQNQSAIDPAYKSALEDAENRILSLRRKIQDVTIRLSEIRSRKGIMDRIKELEEKIKTCSKEYDELQYGVSLCEQYEKTRVGFLKKKVNDHFTSVKFQLFEEQINGGIKECCKVLVPGSGNLVRYESANNAARINAGLEIIDVLSAFYGISLPVFVDNAESVVELVDILPQTIRLVVSENDKVLRVEAE